MQIRRGRCEMCYTEPVEMRAKKAGMRA